MAAAIPPSSRSSAGASAGAGAGAGAGATGAWAPVPRRRATVRAVARRWGAGRGRAGWASKRRATRVDQFRRCEVVVQQHLDEALLRSSIWSVSNCAPSGDAVALLPSEKPARKNARSPRSGTTGTTEDAWRRFTTGRSVVRIAWGGTGSEHSDDRPRGSMLHKMKRPRTADPYRDLDVIDSRAPRFNQATIGLLALLAVLTGMGDPRAARGAVGDRPHVRQAVLPALSRLFRLVQPLVGEGPVEDSRPPRFANMVGTAAGRRNAGLRARRRTVSRARASCRRAGRPGRRMGLCAGCETLPPRRAPPRRSLPQARPGRLSQTSGWRRTETWSSSSPIRSAATARPSSGASLGGATSSPSTSRSGQELARKYGVALVPTAVSVSSTGTVLARLAG